MTASTPVLKQFLIGCTTVQAVSGRDLHAFLQIPTAFKDWIRRRIRGYRFEENVDFTLFLGRSRSDRPVRDYVLTLSMAHIIAILERSDRGQQARLYFIECERERKIESRLAPLIASSRTSFVSPEVGLELLEEATAVPGWPVLALDAPPVLGRPTSVPDSTLSADKLAAPKRRHLKKGGAADSWRTV